MRSLALDPSNQWVGWSTFNSKAHSKRKAWKWGTFRLEGVNLEMRIIDLVQKLDEEINMDRIEFLITERPAFYSSQKGMIAAHQNYTIDLAAVAYYVAGWYRFDHRKHFAITATQWKGTVPKAVTARRFFRDFPEINPGSLSEHAIDATMMHRWWLENVTILTPRVLRQDSPEVLQSLL